LEKTHRETNELMNAVETDDHGFSFNAEPEPRAAFGENRRD
jgi:hypothetical protein